ncbi:MAG: cytochrome c3 family protein [Thermoanaerobaculia bacterium]
MRTIVLLLTLAAAIAFADHGPKLVTIDAAAKKQPPVTFEHGKHAAERVESCDTCHHTNEGLTHESEAKVEKCSVCHLDPEGNVPSMRDMSPTKNPFHSLCIGCHRQQRKGATICTECHKRR